MKRSYRLPPLPYIESLSRLADRCFPFVSFRLSAALRIGRRPERAAAFNVLHWWSHVLTVGIVILAACSALGLFVRDMVWMWIGLVGAAGYPIFRYRHALGQAAEYRERIAYDLPEWLQIMVIYLYAGLTASTAVRSSAARWKRRSGPLPELVHEASVQLSYQTPLSQVLNQMAGHADTSDMKAVVTVLLTYTMRGGDATIDTLLDISRQLWSKRLALVRKKAEETTVKLIFPLILIFIAILLIVGAPAVMFVSA